MNFKNYIQHLSEKSSSMNDIKIKYKDELEKFNVYEYDNKISIDLIVVKSKENGTGTKIMEEIIKSADENKKICVLSPSSEFGGNKKRLIEFYKRFGFVENKGKNKEFGIFETMYRNPK